MVGRWENDDEPQIGYRPLERDMGPMPPVPSSLRQQPGPGLKYADATAKMAAALRAERPTSRGVAAGAIGSALVDLERQMECLLGECAGLGDMLGAVTASPANPQEVDPDLDCVEESPERSNVAGRVVALTNRVRVARQLLRGIAGGLDL